MNLKGLENRFNVLRELIIKRFNFLGMRTTGQFAESLRFEVTNKNGIIEAIMYGISYSKDLIEGRAPQQKPFPTVQAIRDWVRIKGLAVGRAINSVAFLVRRSIIRRGTTWYRKKSKLVSSAATPRFKQSVIDEVSKEIINNYRQTILRAYGK